MLAGLFKIIVVFLYFCGRGIVVAVIYIPVALTGGDVMPRGVFTILSLSWPLVLHAYRHVILAILEATESEVAFARIQVRALSSSHTHSVCGGDVRVERLC